MIHPGCSMKRILPSLAVCWATVCLPASVALANSLNWTHFGLRPLGMGNAFVSIADDYNALFYNPAGLARLKTWDGEFLSPRLEASDTTSDLVSDVLDLLQDTSTNDAVLDLIDKLIGKTFYAKLALSPHLVFPGFGFGLGWDVVRAESVFRRTISVDADIGTELIMPISYAFNTFEDRLSLGFTLKGVLRAGVDEEFSVNSIEDFSNQEVDDFVAAGYGVGVDFGLLFTPTEKMQPTFGLSIADVGGTSFQSASSEFEKTPPVRLPTMNVGMSLVPMTYKSTYLRLAVESHGINLPVHFSQKLNMGLEWGYRQLLKIQTGLYKGDITAGLQFDVGLLYLRFATYAEQLGPIAGQEASRRVAVQLKLLL